MHDIHHTKKTQRIVILTPQSADTITADVFDIHIVELVVQQAPFWQWPLITEGKVIKKRGPLVDVVWNVTRGKAMIDNELREVVETLPGFWRKA